jgi:selenium-binding protein 1
VRGYAWDGEDLKQSFDLDFTGRKLGRPHHMLFGSSSMGGRKAKPEVAFR